MVFPVSAATVNKPELAEIIDFAISKILDSSYYSNLPDSFKNYYFCTYLLNSAGTTNVFLHFVNSSTITSSNNGCYRLSYQTNTNLVYYVGGSDYSVSLIPDPEYSAYVRVVCLKSDKTQAFVSPSQYFITDRSNATFYNQSAVLPNVAWQIRLFPDTTELQELLVEADKITDIGYTAPTWTRFDTARSAGHELLARPSYTETEITSTTVELRTSMNELSLNSSVPVVPSGKGYDLGTGDISGFLAPAYPMFSAYLITIRPILIGLFAILFSLKIIPIVFSRLFSGFKR